MNASLSEKRKVVCALEINGKDYKRLTANTKGQAEKIAERLRLETEAQLAKSQTDVEYNVAVDEYLTTYCGLVPVNGERCIVRQRSKKRPRIATLSFGMMQDFFEGRFMLDIDPPLITEYVNCRREQVYQR